MKTEFVLEEKASFYGQSVRLAERILLLCCSEGMGKTSAKGERAKLLGAECQRARKYV